MRFVIIVFRIEFKFCTGVLKRAEFSQYSSSDFSRPKKFSMTALYRAISLSVHALPGAFIQKPFLISGILILPALIGMED